MKRFFAYFAALLMFIASITVVVGAVTDAPGFRAYLVEVLPLKSVPFLMVLCVAGVAYTVVAGIKYYALVEQRNKKLPSYLVDIAFGLIGVVIASASYVTMPFADTDGLVSTQYTWLLVVLQEVMSLCGVFFPAISAITFVLVVPMVGASIVYSEHELEAKYRRKPKRADNKVMSELRRLCGMA